MPMLVGARQRTAAQNSASPSCGRFGLPAPVPVPAPERTTVSPTSRVRPVSCFWEARGQQGRGRASAHLVRHHVGASCPLPCPCPRQRGRPCRPPPVSDPSPVFLHLCDVLETFGSLTHQDYFVKSNHTFVYLHFHTMYVCSLIIWLNSTI